MNNLAIRTISGIVFCAVMVCGLIFSPYIYGALFLFIMLVALKEFFNISLGQRMVAQQQLALLSATTFFCLFFCKQCFGISSGWMTLSLIPFAIFIVSVLFIDTARERFGLISYIFVALLYIALPISLSSALVFEDGIFSGYFLLGLFIIIWASDVGAYCFGTAFGQKPTSKKLAPRISPKKSWWGVWGGLVLSIAAALVLYYVGWFKFSIPVSIALGVLISVSGIVGDLFESLWKRYFGVKDSGDFIPGHGGMLDRFDSSLFAIPMAIVFLTIISHI